MARLLHEIDWGEPVVPVPEKADYEAELGRRFSPWLGAALQSLMEGEKVSYAPLRLMGIAYFVASQENACRYCYGMSRAIMKMWGYSEKQVQDLENKATLADGLTRRVVEFSRKLARSNPSPAREDHEALVAAGLRPEAVAEIAACVVKACFANRAATFLALPPNEAFERLPETFIGRIQGFLMRRKLLPHKAPPPLEFRNEGPCAPIIAAAGETHMALWLRGLADGWISSRLIPRRSRVLMLAVIARQLGSRLCEEEARAILAQEGLAGPETDAVLATLASPVLTPLEEKLLRWTRETVWYEPRLIQDSTRRLKEQIGEEQTLEAVGSAAVCNTLARLALVLQ
jgi:alkylhydroperoxidase family enzyme